MKNKIISNLKHLPSTVAGLAGVALVALQNPEVQKVVALNPALAVLALKVATIAAGLQLIFGTGAQK